MANVQQSLIFHLLLTLWEGLRRAYAESGLGHLLARFTAWLSAKWERSFLVHLFYDESRFSQSWEFCLLRRVSEWVLNLPLRFMQWVYGKFQKLFDQSFFAALAFEAGRESFLAAGWFMALILVIPSKYWNNAYSLVLFALVLTMIFVGGMNAPAFRLSLRPIGPYVVLFFAAVAAAVPLSNYPRLSLRFLNYHIACFLAVLALVSAVENSRQLLRAAGGLAMGILAAAGYGIYQGLVIGVEVNASFVDLTVNANMPGRVYSYFENPNALGELLLLGLPILVALVFGSRRWVSKLCAAGIFCVGAVCLGMTYCRASWVGLVAAALLYVFFWNRKLLPLCFAAGFAAIPLLPASILNRILTIGNFNDTSTASRFPQYAAALRLLAGEPVSGAGLGVDAVRQTVRIKTLYQGYAPFVHAHNTFLQVWLECGLLGLVTFVGAILSAVKSTARCVKHCPDTAARHMAIGGASAVAGAAVCGLADYLWTYPRIMFVFWFVFGLTLAAIKVCNLEAERV